jgi:hypothetical protein
LALEFGRRRVPLTPSEGFALAERLIRGATRAIIQDEADHAVVSAPLNPRVGDLRADDASSIINRIIAEWAQRYEPSLLK